MLLDDVNGVDFSCKNLPNNRPITVLDLVWVGNTLTELAGSSAADLLLLPLNIAPAPTTKLSPKEFANLVNSLYDESAFTRR